MASFHNNKGAKKPWSVRFIIIENGREKHKRLSGFTKRTDANQAYLDFMADYKPTFNMNSTTQLSDLKYDDLVIKYFKNDKTKTKESTHVDKIGTFKRFIEPALKNKNIARLDKRFCHEWQANLWQKPYAYKYKTKIRGYLNNFLNWVEEVYEVTNKLKYVKIPKRIEPKKEMLIWELWEIEKFLESCDDMLLKTLIMFQFYTGNRIGETFALSDRDIYNGQVIVNKIYSRKTLDGKGKIIPTTKNYVIRNTPIPAILQKQLDDYFLWKRKNKISSTFLFGGDKPIAETTLRRSFSQYTHEAGLKRIRVHDLRHSYVSMLKHIGLDNKIIASLIGDTEEQVIKTYAHLYNDDKENAIDFLNAELGKKLGKIN